MYFHRGVNTQRGRGFGSLFSGLFRSIFPLAKSVGKRVLQSQFVKNLSSQAIDAGKDMVKNIASDVLSGKKFKESAENELNIAKKKVGEAIRGRGYKRKRKHNQKSVSRSNKKDLQTFYLLN